MPNISIATWNCQGSPLNSNAKQTVINNLIGNGYEIILLQECGSLVNQNAFSSYTLYGAEQVGNFNNRCSTAILYDAGVLQVISQGMSVKSSSGRPIVWIEFQKNNTNIFVATIHCVSSNTAGQDRKQAAIDMQKQANGSAIIIGGDFNVSPPGYLNTGSYNNAFYYGDAACGQATQQSGGELDYFLHDSNVSVTTTAHRGWDPTNLNNNNPSDHTWVRAVFQY